MYIYCHLYSYIIHSCFRDLANKLWESSDLDFPAEQCSELVQELQFPVECIQVAVAEALATLLAQDRNQLKGILAELVDLYKSRLDVR